MSDSLPPSESQPIEERRRSQRRRSGASPFVVGLVLITVGIIFIVQRFAGIDFTNWWALFILIAAFGSFSNAWNVYRRTGRLTTAVRSSIFGGLIILTVALIFLLNLSWSTYWPLFVLLPGLSAFFSGLRLGGEPDEPLSRHLYQPWQVWLGAGAALLGLGFLLQNLSIWDPVIFHPRWWALPIFLPALGGLITTVRLVGERGFDWLVGGSLLATLIVAGIGTIAFLGMDWNLILPLALIGVGVLVLLGVWGRVGSR
jgi:hypothetical protein